MKAGRNLRTAERLKLKDKEIRVLVPLTVKDTEIEIGTVGKVVKYCLNTSTYTVDFKGVKAGRIHNNWVEPVCQLS